MKLLSLKELDMFDYVETRKNVVEHTKDLNMIQFKYRNVLPPPLAGQLFDIKVQSSPTNRSSIESYVEKRDEFLREYKEKLDEINDIIKDFSYHEQRFFKDHFIHGVKVKEFEKTFRCGPDMVDHIKQSSVIKFALALDIAVYK
ncbi:MAG: hypothetical protein IJ134_00250 [Bacilli bacterium]|nr:hypothetical protein [Bacilli bacterium]MBR1386686.1 hypothetical protein [Bacilli bacterium]